MYLVKPLADGPWVGGGAHHICQLPCLALCHYLLDSLATILNFDLGPLRQVLHSILHSMCSQRNGEEQCIFLSISYPSLWGRITHLPAVFPLFTGPWGECVSS